MAKLACLWRWQRGGKGLLEKDEEDRDNDGCLDGLAEDEEEDGDGEELHCGLFGVGCLQFCRLGRLEKMLMVEETEQNDKVAKGTLVYL